MEELKLMIDYCTKTVATVGGDGYSEIVLYQTADGEYQLHTYSRYQPDNIEHHAAYRTDDALYERVLSAIKEEGLYEWIDHQGFGLLGGEVILKWRDGEELLRITSGNCIGGSMAIRWEYANQQFLFTLE